MQNLDLYLQKDDLEAIAKHDNKPLAILQLNAKQLGELKQENEIDTFTHMQFDNTLIRFCDSMGKAERIKNTVFPTTYRLFLHLTIYLFVIILALALKSVAMHFEIILLAAIASVFFLIEKSSTLLQDPFSNRPSDTPVTAIAKTIEINIRQLLNEKNVPKPVKPNSYYIM
jgi:ion channel-forming bestrophin family protein